MHSTGSQIRYQIRRLCCFGTQAAQPPKLDPQLGVKLGTKVMTSKFGPRLASPGAKFGTLISRSVGPTDLRRRWRSARCRQTYPATHPNLRAKTVAIPHGPCSPRCNRAGRYRNVPFPRIRFQHTHIVWFPLWYPLFSAFWWEESGVIIFD
jgi:hypothetical protein